jgi:hypothetical protein
MIVRAAWLIATLAVLAGPLAPAAVTHASTCTYPVHWYGTWSLGTRAGTERVSLQSRMEELQSLGANMVVGIGGKKNVLDALPPDMLAVPGCSLMHQGDWKSYGYWDEAKARKRLQKLARRYDGDHRVYAVCITHEVTEYADHARRVWMYRLAKEYFRHKPVIQYYGVLWDRLNPTGLKVYNYGENGERETDVLLVSLQPIAQGHFDATKVYHLREALDAAARTPGVPVWGQTSINADHAFVTGPDSMTTVWGPHGENMKAWTDALFAMTGPDMKSGPLRLTGFFWRSLGRFPWDLGYPAFADHRGQVRAIGRELCAKS